MGKRCSLATDKLVAAAAVAVGLAGFGDRQADASLIVDVRATHVTPAGTGTPIPVVGDGKTVAAQEGDVVTLKAFAVVSGTDVIDNESFAFIHGSYVSTGPLLGTLAHQLHPLFNTSGSQVGSNADIDADGDLDVGQPPGGVGTGYVVARASEARDGTRVGAAEEFEIGTLTFTVQGGGDGALIDFVRRRTSTGGNNNAWASWQEDGLQFHSGNPGGLGGADRMGSSPAQIWVPEPTGPALASLAALGLLSRRRNTGSA